MTKRKEELSSDFRKSGYLKVGRTTLRALFSQHQEQRGLAAVLLCVQTFAYFSDGNVCLNNQSVFCRAGEWITSYTEIAGLTGLDRRLVKKHLLNLEKRGFLHIHDLGNYKRIVLATWEPEMIQNTNNPLPDATSNCRLPDTGMSLMEQANRIYQSAGGEQKWTN
ncbi:MULTISPECIES: hypothetical protein [Parabacteroides]|uniref:hypothetical protein n=1 Tax=Parabacteroides leei TaxID=2939491 RepID=UPI00189BF3A2|nr:MULTISPECIES: hypothetical protein [Parabacteroides]MCL3852073.1 hypothetical protein [Parabacteroides leei]